MSGSSSSRPIPISLGSCTTSSQQSLDDNDDSEMLMSPSALMAYSCPESGNGAYFQPRLQPRAAPQQQPPRAPRFGSLPEPSFLQMDVMPDLMLPPRAASPGTTQSSFREPSVLQFATSCPASRRGFYPSRMQPQQRPWAPSPRTPDELDLSKSPALAMISGMHASLTTLGAREPRGFYGEELRHGEQFYGDNGFADQIPIDRLMINEDEYEDDEEETLAALTGNGYADHPHPELYGRADPYAHAGTARRGSYDGVFQFDQFEDQ